VGEIPGVGQRLVWLDGKHLAVQHAAPVSAKIETVAHDRLEIVLHEPLLDQVRLGERAPEFFRRMGYLTLDNDGEGRGSGHWSILLSQIFEVVEAALPEAGHLARPVDQRGQGAELGAIVRLAAFMAVAHQPRLLQDPEMFRDRRLRDAGPGRQVSRPSVLRRDTAARRWPAASDRRAS